MRLKFVLLCFAGFLLVACSSGGGSNTTITNNSQAAIQALTNQYFESNAATLGFSGISVTAQCNGMNNSQPVSVYAGNVGESDPRPVNGSYLWQIGSNTKSFMAVILLQLASESQYNFSLDDPLSKWLPQYTYWNANNGQPTIRQILHMVSGIPNNATESLVTWVFANPYTYLSPESLIGYAPESLAFSPGNGWVYSNTGYNILGLLITRITGNSPGVEIENRILKPLGLNNTYFVYNLPTDVVDVSLLMKGYFTTAPNQTGPDVSLWSLSSAYTAGALISTTQDVNTYYRALWTSTELLNPNQLAQLTALVSESTGQAIESPASSPYGAFGLGIGAINFNAYNQYVLNNYQQNWIPLNDTNILNNINNYNLVYQYNGATFGNNVHYYYNPINGETVITAYNSNNGDYVQELDLNILNYMDPICQAVLQ